MRASPSWSTTPPRALLMNLGVRLIMPWRLPACPATTLPVPVILKRFFTPLLVFILGILLPFVFVSLAKRREAAACRAATPSAFMEKLPSRHGMPVIRRAAHEAGQ